jgi:D-serine deaminase-like pyridoxal phosphate-dependent protein
MRNQPLKKTDIDTPALLLDLDILKRNIAKMASFAQDAGVNLRPHCKTHKSPRIAALQLEAGAIGITCQKLGEAEVMAGAGIENLLIANQIVGDQKLSRLVDLCRQANVTVAVDDPRNVSDLSRSAAEAGVTIGALVEVDIGMGRCGVPPGDPALDLAKTVLEAPGLEFRGLMGYEGHTVMIKDPEERRQKATEALQHLMNTVELLRAIGVPVPIVSSSGTGTFDVGGRFSGVTEIQVGSYATMDGRYRQVDVPFECALTVLTTVISTPRDGIVIADAGIKSVTIEFGLPEVVGLPGAHVQYLSEEHAKIELPDGFHLDLGEKIAFLPMHGCTTINLHDRFYVLQEDKVRDVWPVAARGQSQ